MTVRRLERRWTIAAAALAACVVLAGVETRAAKKKSPVYTTVEAARKAGADFDIQGEYEGALGGDAKKKIGVQVIALGGGAFQAVFYRGGLPGAGWDGKTKAPVDGKLDGRKAVFAPSKSKKRYLGRSPAEFSAVRNNPAAGQKNYGATIEGGKLTGMTDKGEPIEAKRIVRKSPTLGAKPPAGATVLFDGKSRDAWTGGRVDEKTRLLNTDGRDIRTKARFTNFTLHVEFMLPYRPSARGQGRANSGLYLVDHYECQILDSFGLAGLNNECGGFYKKADCKVNMCLPPLQWQTYDVEFTSAARDAKGKKTSNAIATVRHNGVVIHEKLSINGPTGGSRRAPEGTPGPNRLQGHGNPLQFRNIWIVVKK